MDTTQSYHRHAASYNSRISADLLPSGTGAGPLWTETPYSDNLHTISTATTQAHPLGDPFYYDSPPITEESASDMRVNSRGRLDWVQSQDGKHLLLDWHFWFDLPDWMTEFLPSSAYMEMTVYFAYRQRFKAGNFTDVLVVDVGSFLHGPDHSWLPFSMGGFTGYVFRAVGSYIPNHLPKLYIHLTTALDYPSKPQVSTLVAAEFMVDSNWVASAGLLSRPSKLPSERSLAFQRDPLYDIRWLWRETNEESWEIVW